MVYGLQAIVFVNGCVTGILAAGAMLRFKLRFGVSNTVTGMFYFATYVIGSCCLLAMTTFKGTRTSDKIKIFKPAIDLIIFLTLLLAFFASYTIDSFAPAAVGLTGAFAFCLASNGSLGRLIQARVLNNHIKVHRTMSGVHYLYLHVYLYRHLSYIQAYLPKGQGGRLLARMQAIRYAGVCVSSFLVTFLGNDQRQVAALMHATLGLLACSVTIIIVFVVIRVRAAQAFNGRAVLDVDIFGFEYTSAATFRWASRAAS